MDFEFGELKNDVNFVSKVQAVAEAVAKIEDAIKATSDLKNVDDLTPEDRVKLDLFQVYAVNSLYWNYLKINGENPAAHGIKHELSRIKEAMERQKQIHDHKTIRPVLQQDAAKRMVRGGLYDFKKKNEDFKKRHQQAQNQQKAPQKIIINNQNLPNKKRKFNDD